jgi:hypothetical protein
MIVLGLVRVRDRQGRDRVVRSRTLAEIAGEKCRVSRLGMRIHSTGPSIAMVLFDNRRAMGNWVAISGVTGWD